MLKNEFNIGAGAMMENRSNDPEGDDQKQILVPAHLNQDPAFQVYFDQVSTEMKRL